MTLAEDLHEEYQAKRKVFSDQLTTATNEGLRQKLLHCALTVDLCLLTMIALGDCLGNLPKYLQRELDEASARNAEVMESVSECFENAGKMSSGELRQIVVLQAEYLAATHTRTHEICVTFAHLLANGIQASVAMAHESLFTLLKSNESEANIHAVKKLVLNVFGMVPGANLFPGLYDIYEIMNSREHRTRKASDYLNELDSFVFVGYQWSTAVQLLIDLLQSLETAQDFSGLSLPAADAAKRVSDRFEGIVKATAGDAKESEALG